MNYAFDVGIRYLRSKKRATVSVISIIAITGVALGVGALLSVISITSGFQDEFRNKVLGVNAHVLVLKYGLNFEEYRDVVEMAEQQPEVRGAAPFIINEMMLAKGDRLSGVLIKGVDPDRMKDVLDVPGQLQRGSLDGIRLPDSVPPMRPEDLERPPAHDDRESLDELLLRLARSDGGTDPLSDDPAIGVAAGAPDAGSSARAEGGSAGAVDSAGSAGSVGREGSAQHDDSPGEGQAPGAAQAAPAPASDMAVVSAPEGGLPEVDVPSVSEMNAALAALDDLPALPDDDAEDVLLTQDAEATGQIELLDEGADPDRVLPGVVVGTTLAENLGLDLGDVVKVISPLTGIDTSMWRPDGGGTPKSRDFRVIGVFKAGFQEYDSKLVYMDLYEAQRFQDQGDTVVGVEISLHDIEAASDVALRLERELGGGPFHTMDWKELNNNLFTALAMQKVVLSIVIGLITVVAAFNVIATLIMIVLEKRREIAILKAMGAKDSAVLQIFVVQGAAIGVVGTIVGLLLGSGVCAYLSIFEFPLDPKVYLISRLPVRASPMEFILTTVIALTICVASTLIPSWWAARMLPADGVRAQ